MLTATNSIVILGSSQEKSHPLYSMVATITASQAAKRKKTADMPESPPKRVTRARAKATTEPGMKPKTTKITTGSANASVQKKQSIEPAKPVKRKTRADDENDEPIQEPVVEHQPKSKPAKAGIKIKKAVEAIASTAEDAKSAEPPAKPRGRPAKAVVVEEPATEAQKPKGRAKKTVTPVASIRSEGREPAQEAQPVTRTTRGRAAPAAVNNSTVASLPKPQAAKKKVKFQDESDKDKENVPIQSKAQKTTISATGLRAKPIRKPAVARTSARGRKAIAQKTQTEDRIHEDKVCPLSPKKVKQVAKSSSISSEDELCGEKSPMRALSISPVKPPMSLNKHTGDAVSKLDFTSTAESASPTKGLSSTVLASPVRRPPQSPFKDALKESPKRGNLGASMERPTPSTSHSPARILFGESARRGNLGDALGQRPLLSSQSPTKASLLQSPARRPVGSPVKMAAPKTPGKSSLCVPTIDAVTASKQVNNFILPELSSQRFFTSPLRAAKPPGSAVKVHKITTEDQEAALRQADSIHTPTKSPVKSNEVVSTPLLDGGLETSEETIMDAPALEGPSQTPLTVCKATSEECGGLDLVNSAEELVDVANELRSTTPPGPPSLFAASALPSIFLSPRHAPAESDSEDELSSPQKAYAPNPLRNFGVSTKDFSTPSNTRPSPEVETLQGVNERELAQDNLQSFHRSKGKTNAVSVTPLAVQLSSWLASSPEKKTPSNRSGQGRGIFSLRSATVLDRPQQVVVESPPGTSFFEDQMAMCELDGDEIMDEPEFHHEDLIEIQASQDSVVSQASEEYGDENAMPVDPLLLKVEQKAEDHTLTCTPARVFSEQPREIHTVSKVPLRPAGDDSPRKVPRKRSKSLTGPLAVINTPEMPGAVRSSTMLSINQGINSSENSEQGKFLVNFATPTKGTSGNPQTPKVGSFSIGGTPLGMNIIPDVLKGAVVYVDVHTTEGADASGIFVELLTQMGARCVKQWSWNPRASVTENAEGETEPSDASTPGGKIGITHVVYKDGGKRTLEKVRESRGVVLCVGVGWVLG